ncbi:MAG: acetate--CoA ligase family protein [Oscillospiraceae bacterium]|nr:acetate--CoA ligase family protein [Oscillospiraceae bacterium]
MLTPVHNPILGRLRVIGYASGSGDTLWKAYELQKEMEQTPEGCPFEIVGVFCSKADSKAAARAKELGVPSATIDIKEYYAQRDKPLKDREVRAQYDAAALDLIRPMKGDAILLAGYVWATTDCLLDEYLIINVHPADLSIQKEGKRLYAGGNGVGDALAGKEPNLCSTSHIATKQVDGGPILVISERVPVDYTLHADETERMRHYLKLVNEQSRMVGARTLLEVASGNFVTDEDGAVYYKGEKKPLGIRIESWGENIPMHKRETRKMLYPNSVVVIGASDKPGIGRSVVQNILRDGFKGEKYVVNMRAEDVMGVKGYASVGEIPGDVDMAIIVTPGKAVLQVAEECGKKGVKALVCVSAGFKEVGGEGIAAQEKLVEIVHKYNMRLIGPNCMGVISVAANLNGTILHTPFVHGGVALFTQSGSIGASMLDYAEELGIGLSAIVSLGNQADITVCDLLPFYENDEHTKVIVLYLESILEPARLVETAKRMTKPILLVKSGRTSAGMAAASSHTGSLAGDDQVVDALIHKAGITRMKSLEECFYCAAALSNLPKLKGNRVGVLTNAGGMGILISDAASDFGFELPPPSDTLKAKLAENLMAEASVQNPIDVVAPAPPEHYSLSARLMIESGEYDALLVCCVPPATVDTGAVAQALVPIIREAKIPVLSNYFGPTLGKAARDVMNRERFPFSEYPEQMALMLNGMRAPVKYADETQPRALKATVRAAEVMLAKVSEGDYLPVEDAYAILDSFGIHVPGKFVVASSNEVMNLNLSYPLVAKIEHPEIVHKSDVGGVRLNIMNADEAVSVVNEFMARFTGAKGVLLQEMVPQGTELIVGSIRDPQLGNSIMLGLGGVWVEIMKDVTFGYPPISKDQAMAMIDSLRCEPLLAGYRGKPGVDKNALVDVICRVSGMLSELPMIAEIDLNPILFDPAKGAFVAADVRIRKDIPVVVEH